MLLLLLLLFDINARNLEHTSILRDEMIEETVHYVLSRVFPLMANEETETEDNMLMIDWDI